MTDKINGPTEAEIARLTAEMAGWLASQHYSYIGRDGKRVLARELEDRAEKAEAERDAALAGARKAHDALWELNPNNYDHDEVCKLNDGAIEAILTLAPLIGETHGYSPEWWNQRAALQPDPDARQADLAKAWQPIETAPRKRGERIIGWCVFPAGSEAREVKCFVPIGAPFDGPSWFYQGIKQNVTHWMPLPTPPADLAARIGGE